MFVVVRKIVKICLYALLIILGINFSVANRSKIELTLFPLPYAVSAPIFIFIIAAFVAGILVGWAITRFKSSKFKKLYKTASTRISALENELTALHSENMIK